MNSSRTGSTDTVAYVDRDYDPALRADVTAAADGRFRGLILLRGGSSTGKTRSLFEAVHACCIESPRSHRRRVWGKPAEWLVLRPAGREALRVLPNDNVLGRAPTILWLNELQGFLGPNGLGLTRRLLEDLHDASSPHPLVVVSTIWPSKLTDHLDTDDESTRDTRELLTGRPEHLTRHDVGERLSETETTRARAMIEKTGDQRARQALENRNGFGFTQGLAGADELVERYLDTGNGPGLQLVLEAAGDYRRLGGVTPMSENLLTGMARASWDDLHKGQRPPPGEFENGMAVATTRLRDKFGGVRPLIPLSRGGYDLADYLEQYLTEKRRSVGVVEGVWSVLTESAAAEDLLVLAAQAGRRGLFATEKRLLDRAAALGTGGSHLALARWSRDRGRREDAVESGRTAMLMGDPDAATDLVLQLDTYGWHAQAEQVLRDAAEAGQPDAAMFLADRLDDEGRGDEAEQVLRAAIADGDPTVYGQLAEHYDERGRHHDAEQILRAAVLAGHPWAHNTLADWLDEHRRHDEAEQVLRDGTDADVWSARAQLMGRLEDSNRHDESELMFLEWLQRHTDERSQIADRLTRQGRDDEAETAWRDAVRLGEPDAFRSYAAWLSDRDRDDEAEQVLREAMARGDPNAHRRLANWLDDRAHHTEAERVLHDATTSDANPFAYKDLIARLDGQGRYRESERVWRAAVSEARTAHVRSEFAAWLESRGRPGAAEQAWREAADARDPFAHRALVRLLEEQGRDDEVEAVLRDGVIARAPDARANLVHWLDARGRADAAHQVLRDGVIEGEVYAHERLARWHELRGHPDEAEAVLRDAVTAGVDGAFRNLVRWLDEQGRADEAAAAKRSGLDTRGRTIQSCDEDRG